MTAACDFCAIIAGDAPAEIVARDDATISFMDINPATDGHLLVVPLRHAPDIWAISDDENAALSRTAYRLTRRMRDALRPEGLTLLQSNGAAAFQTVFHLHIHLIPRWPGDGLRLPWRPTPGHPAAIRAAADRIRAAG